MEPFEKFIDLLEKGVLGPVLGALIALSGVLIGGARTARSQRRLEGLKARNTREDLVSKEILTATQQLTISVASALHSMCWLTWLAATKPKGLSQTRITTYDEEQHIALPKILAYQSTVSALDHRLFDQLAEHVETVFRLDAEIGRIGLFFDEDPISTAASLAGLYGEMRRLEHELPKLLSDIVAARVREPATVNTRVK